MHSLWPEECVCVSDSCVCLNSYTPGRLLFWRGSSGDSTPFVWPQPKASALSAGKGPSPLKPELGGWCLQPWSVPQASSWLAAAVQNWEHSDSRLCPLLCHLAAFQGHSEHRCHHPPSHQRCCQGSNHTEHCFDTSATCFVCVGKSH